MASIMLLILYFTFASPHFAYAANVDSIRPKDHNHERLLGTPFLDMDNEDLEPREVVYEADFLGYDRGIIGRAPTSNEPTALINNRMVQTNIVQGTTVSYSFLSSSLHAGSSSANGAVPSVIPLRRKDKEEGGAEDKKIDEDEELPEDFRLRTRQLNSGNGVTLYVSVNTCSQPGPIKNVTVTPPPQLQLYISQSENNTNPGPGQDSATQNMMALDGGAGVYIVNATGDVFIGLYGENTTDYQGVWNAEIAASIDAPYHYFHNTSSDPNIYLVDSDSVSALLITQDLNSTEPDNSSVYDAWLNIAPPYVIFASPQNDQAIRGVQNSYCGLQNFATIKPTTVGETTDYVQTGITARGIDNGPKQQFYITGLTASSAYNIVLAMNGNSSASGDGVVGGGGQVWPMTNFTTLTGMHTIAYSLLAAEAYCPRWQLSSDFQSLLLRPNCLCCARKPK
jgi:calcium channel MID1